MAEPIDLASAVEQLYGGPNAEFMMRRTALVAEAKRLKDKEVAARIGVLRKPSVAAAIINTVVRGRPDVRESLDHVGARLRAAQATLHGTALTALRPERDQLIEDFLAAAREVARGLGQSLTQAAATEIRDTVIAAIASEDAAVAVTSGHLTRTLTYSGFGEVDLADAIVTTSNGTLLRVLPGLRNSRPDAPEAAPGAATPSPTTTAETVGVETVKGEAVPAEAGDGAPGGAEHPPAEAGYGEPGGAEHPPAEAGDGEQAGGEVGGEAGGDPGVGELVPVEATGAHVGPPIGAAGGSDGGEDVDPEVAAAEAAATYAAAAAGVVSAKSAARAASADVDRLKEMVARLTASVEAAQRELEEAFRRDAEARVAVTASIATRQSAAAGLAAAQALHVD